MWKPIDVVDKNGENKTESVLFYLRTDMNVGPVDKAEEKMKFENKRSSIANSIDEGTSHNNVDFISTIGKIRN